ncbi:hypothetical protein RR48_06840 [Papilio machaon]|uniref:Uncharacterized protein n=1 Tax=Papilio machaon TaxID=76193 RepID=A0A194RAP0_PAPMA|nr:hypothetical protein RR48_06840 [Papilio machaon]
MYKVSFVLLLSVQLVFGRKAITVKLDPKNVVNTIRTVFDEQYVEQVADIIAEKAAKRFVNEIIKNFEELDNNPIRSMKVDKEEGRGKNRKEMKIMDNEEALKLLKRPSPDGDNLDEVNKESLFLSKEQEDIKQKKKIPVIVDVWVASRVASPRGVGSGRRNATHFKFSSCEPVARHAFTGDAQISNIAILTLSCLHIATLD